MDVYYSNYQKSIEDPEVFWGPLAKELYWKEPWASGRFLEYNFNVQDGPIFVRWMCEGKTNVCYNVLDKHVKAGKGSKICFYWVGNDPLDNKQITYEDLLKKVCKFANVLKSKGVTKGDRVAIYMPMILELPVVVLACARIGAVHSVVFGGFSAEALASRLVDAEASIILSADGVWRGTKLIKLKEIVDEAISISAQHQHSVKHAIIVRHLTTGDSGPASDCAGKRPYSSLKLNWNNEIDTWYHDEMLAVSEDCDVEWLDSEDPLFMLYTSGSTGTPKGVIHTQAGYLLYASTTFRYVFDYKENDVYFCTADIGWITGHSYVLYGPMANGATGIIFEGIPTHPNPGRYWEIVEEYKVSKFYTAPTAIRALMRHGTNFVRRNDRSSLKVLGSVGEPINPEAWRWYHDVVGESRCSIVDTYWQTETGGHVITPLPTFDLFKPGCATLPFLGVEAAVLSEHGHEIEGPGSGYLVFKKPWPGMMRTVYKNHERFEKTYFSKFPGYYYTSDGCKRDEDGYYWITGRVDDTMNVSGHLLSTSEIESALAEHKAVTEAAVVAVKHDVKGQAPYAFVTLMKGHKFSQDLVAELKMQVRHKIGPVAIPDVIQEAPGLPKTRSGKIMRRILRVIADTDDSCEDNQLDLGDTSTLTDPAVIQELLAKKVPVDSSG